MAEYVELTEAELQARLLAQVAVRRHAELQALAAARTAEAASRLLRRAHGRQRRLMRPLVLDVGARVRVSFLHSNTVRQQGKEQMVPSYLPKYTREVYVVTARRLATQSTRVMLYDLRAQGQLQDGQQAPTRIANLLVRLPLALTNVDRRHLQPLFEDSVPVMGDRIPGAHYAFRLFDDKQVALAKAGDADEIDDDEDWQSNIS